MDRSSSLRQSVLAALALVAFPRAGEATTYHLVTVRCPLDGTEFTALVMMSTHGMVVRENPREVAWAADITVGRLATCPRCGFTADQFRFSQAEGLDRERVREALRNLDSPKYFRKIDAAILVEKNWTRNAALIAHLALTAKRSADATGEPETIRARARAAIEAHEALLREVPHGEWGRSLYWIGKLYREIGEREEAVRWLEIARDYGGDDPLVDRELFLARYEGRPDEEIFAAARNGRGEEQVAAISLLRGSEDERAVAFIEELVNRCPGELRPEAIRALAFGLEERGRPSARHMAAFLAALDSLDSETIAAAARALEALRAAEAAPALVRAFRKRVPRTEHRIGHALAKVATERELDFLSELATKWNPPPWVLEALLRTRCPRAAQSVAHLLTGDSDAAKAVASLFVNQRTFKLGLSARTLGFLEFDGKAVLEDLEAWCEALLGVIPDLGRADPNSAAALVRAHLLGLDRSLAAERELEAALARGGRVAVAAALELAAWGNPKGKDLLIERALEIPPRALESFLSLLGPGDFPKVLSYWTVMESAPDVLRGHMWRPLLPEMLGATRHPEARRILLESLYAPLRGQTQWAQEDIVRGLAYVYDDEIGDALAPFLGEDRGSLASEVLDAMARNRDRRYVDAVAALAQEPTELWFKLRWIQATQELAPDRALPKLREWAESPDPTLAEAARRALANAALRGGKRRGPKKGAMSCGRRTRSYSRSRGAPLSRSPRWGRSTGRTRDPESRN